MAMELRQAEVVAIGGAAAHARSLANAPIAHQNALEVEGRGRGALVVVVHVEGQHGNVLGWGQGGWEKGGGKRGLAL